MPLDARTIVAAGLSVDLAAWLAARLGNVVIRRADNIEGVLEELDRGDVSLLVVSHTLSGIPAVDVLTRARARSVRRLLPVIYLLDRHLDSPMGRELLVQLGVHRLLIQPADREDVAAAIADVLDISLAGPPNVISPVDSVPIHMPVFPSEEDIEAVLIPGRSELGHILIIDGDDSRGQQLVAEAAARGIRADLCPNPMDARNAWEAHRPDAILLDLGIRHGNGEEGLALLEELSAVSPPVPVLVMTARDTLIDRVQVASFGGRGFLQRSAPVGEVLDAVIRVLQQMRSKESRVMVVDDDSAVLAELTTLLEADGIKVIGLDDPLRFWDTLEQMAPDLLVLDLDLARWSGVELCQVVRNDPRWNTLPVLFLTPERDPETLRSIFAAGADDYVTKPVIGPELVTKILNRLERTVLYRSMAEVDPMTGVANRRKSTDSLRQFLRLAERHSQPLSLALLDVDWFKQINDRYGHASGDSVLQQLGKILLRTFRSEDIVARWGGEEFVIGMYGMTRLDGVQRLTDLLETLHHETFMGANSEQIRVTFSAGVAQYPDDGSDVQTLYRIADQALYRAKEAGRDRVMPVGWKTDGVDPGVRAVDVVLVDDDDVLGALLVNALESQGYRTQWLRDGETAALALSGTEPSLRAPVVLLDTDLPGLDGLGVLRRMVRDRVVRRTRVVMLTGRVNDTVTARAMELGAFDHIAKPFTIPTLVKRVRQALEIL